LLADGPASVQIVAGKIEIFGFEPKLKRKMVVQEGKRLPFYTLEATTFNISLGVNACIQEVEGNTTPQSWKEPFNSALNLENKPAIILVLGKADSGKSSFCTYLVNTLVNNKFSTAVLDGDIGQSDIGPSGTIGYALTSKPIINLSSLRLQNAFFVGVTSPILAIAKTLTGLTALKAEILREPPDFVVVNTDGWVTGDIALRYKTAMVKALKPDLVVAIQIQNELEPLIASLPTTIIRVQPSSSLSIRTAEKRKKLRELTYQRYLKGAKDQCYSMTQITVEPKNASPKIKPGRGLLVGLYRSNRFLGIGVLRSIDGDRQVLKIQTAVNVKPSKIFLGKIWLDCKLNEVEFIA
jgi:polynucleotide 5'-hydroxyl-kinase GRC3/NOL9